MVKEPNEPEPSHRAGNTISILLAGDAVITHPWSHIKEKEFLSIIDKIRETDVSIVNLEMLINDFEGYKLFKSTERSFIDAEKISNGFGIKSYNMWIFQCDLKNDLFGFTDYAYVEGAGYYLGENTGIQHYFVDTDVENGHLLLLFDRL